jgi:hypothetical protein
MNFLYIFLLSVEIIQKINLTVCNALESFLRSHNEQPSAHISCWSTYRHSWSTALGFLLKAKNQIRMPIKNTKKLKDLHSLFRYWINAVQGNSSIFVCLPSPIRSPVDLPQAGKFGRIDFVKLLELRWLLANRLEWNIQRNQNQLQLFSVRTDVLIDV